jgi:putative transposase
MAGTSVRHGRNAHTDVLKAHGVAISMDGKGRWVDNVFVSSNWI